MSTVNRRGTVSPAALLSSLHVFALLGSAAFFFSSRLAAFSGREAFLFFNQPFQLKESPIMKRLFAPSTLGAALAFSLLAGLAAPAAHADTVLPTAIAVGSVPRGVAIAPDGSRVYVANYNSNTVSEIDPASNTVVNTVAVHDGPWGLAVNPSGSVFVTSYATNAVGTFVAGDASSTDIMDNTFASYPFGIAATTVSGVGKIYFTNYGNDTVVAMNPDGTGAVAIAVGTSPLGVAATPDGKYVYAANRSSNNVSVIDTASNTVVATIAVGTNPYGVAISPDGQYAWVANINSNNVSVIATAENANAASRNTVVATVAVGTNPEWVALTPDGQYAYVANNGGNNVSVINTAVALTAPASAVVSTLAVGTRPAGVAITPNGQTAYVSNYNDNTVSVITLDTPPALTTATLPAATEKAAYSATIAATGSPAPTLSASGLPTWLSFDPATGKLTGTPPAGVPSYSFDITATSALHGDAANPAMVTRTYTIAVISPLGMTGATSVPTLGEWSLALLGLLLSGGAALRMRRRS